MNNETHEYLHTPTVAVVVPVLQALSVAFVSFLMTFIIVVAINPAKVMLAAQIGGFVCALLSGGFFFVRLWHWYGLTITNMAESVTGLDLNGDNTIAGEPIKERVVVDVVQEDAGGYQQIDRVRFDIDPTILQRLSADVLSKRTFSAALIRKDMLTRDQWERVRDELLQRGSLVLRDPLDPRKGYEVTKPGWALFRHLSRSTPLSFDE